MVHIDEGFDFLGFTIRRMRKRGTQKHYVYTVPSRKAIQAIKDKVAEKTYRATLNQDLGALLQSVNRALAGWANYFRHGVSKAVFSTVDLYAWHRIMRWLRRKYTRTLPPRNARTPPPVLRARDMDGSPATESGSPARPPSRSPARYRYRGSKIPTPWTPRTASQQLSQRARHAESPVR